jgi:FRG domain
MTTSVEIRDWSHFEACIDDLNARWPNRDRWLFRGLPDEVWRLEPSLLRALAPALKAGRISTNRDVWQIEEELLRQFYQDAHNWLDQHELPPGAEMWRWEAWAVMRHFGAPTRLLDWSLSAYVALFFACEDRWDEARGVVWCVNGSAVYTHMQKRYPGSYEEFVSANPLAPAKELVKHIAPPPVVALFHLKQPADRIYMQQGWFSLCSDARLSHEKALHDVLDADAPDALRCLVIPKSLKPDFMRRLQAMNITGRTLFPGVDGLGRSIAGLARLSGEYGSV